MPRSSTRWNVRSSLDSWSRCATSSHPSRVPRARPVRGTTSTRSCRAWAVWAWECRCPPRTRPPTRGRCRRTRAPSGTVTRPRTAAAAGNRNDDQALGDSGASPSTDSGSARPPPAVGHHGRACPGSGVELDERSRSLRHRLTDVRLVLGERLGLREDADVDRLEGAAGRHEERPPAHAMAVYDFLTWLRRPSRQR